MLNRLDTAAWAPRNLLACTVDLNCSGQLFPSCDLDRGNKTALLPDALDVPDACHEPQGLVKPNLRRVRRVRRVDLQFLPPTIPLQATTIIIVARKFFRFSIKRD
jgi:hypothetical protein